jgi:hypothetical protein
LLIGVELLLLKHFVITQRFFMSQLLWIHETIPYNSANTTTSCCSAGLSGSRGRGRFVDIQRAWSQCIGLGLANIWHPRKCCKGRWCQQTRTWSFQPSVTVWQAKWSCRTHRGRIQIRHPPIVNLLVIVIPKNIIIGYVTSRQG